MNGAQTSIGSLGGGWCPGLTGVGINCPNGYFCANCDPDVWPMFLSEAEDPMNLGTELFGQYSNPGDYKLYDTDRGLFFWKGLDVMPNPINLNPYGSLPRGEFRKLGDRKTEPGIQWQEAF